MASHFLEAEVVSGHWVGEGPLVLRHPTTRVSTEASFVLLIRFPPDQEQDESPELG